MVGSANIAIIHSQTQAKAKKQATTTCIGVLGLFWGRCDLAKIQGYPLQYLTDVAQCQQHPAKGIFSVRTPRSAAEHQNAFLNYLRRKENTLVLLLHVTYHWSTVFIDITFVWFHNCATHAAETQQTILRIVCFQRYHGHKICHAFYLEVVTTCWV